MPEKKKVGFIGIGMMGLPMAYPATIGPGSLLKWKQRQGCNRIIKHIY